MFLSASQPQRPHFPMSVRNATTRLDLSNFQVLNPSAKRQNSSSVYNDINSSKRRINESRFLDVEDNTNDSTPSERTIICHSRPKPSLRYSNSPKRSLKRENSVEVTGSYPLISKPASQSGKNNAYDKRSSKNLVKSLEISSRNSLLNASKSSLAFVDAEADGQSNNDIIGNST